MTDFDSPLGCYDCIEFDTVMHVECVEYEHNECRGARYCPKGNTELDIILRELGYMDDETFKIYDSFTENEPLGDLKLFES
jgi:hypothetical protein